MAEQDYERVVGLKPQAPRDEVLLALARSMCGNLAASAGHGREAEREAARTLLLLADVEPNEKEVYRVLHNMACIYGELSKRDEEQRVVLEDEALTYLARAIEVAREHNETETELAVIAQEEAFGQSLRSREAFRALSSRSEP